MFENQLAKLPTTNTGNMTGSSHAELSRNAQSVVHSAERLSSMLKSAGTRATEAQVDAEVDSTSTSRDTTTTANNKSLVEIYGKVASDYRENARTADELVRGITALLLGVGKVVKDFGVQSEFGSPSVHGRHLSLGAGGVDDEMRRRGSPDVVGGGDSTSSGRHSAASSRRSWEHSTRDREREREDTLRRLAGGVTRSESVLARASPSTFQRLRDRDREQEQLETPPPQLQVTTKNPLASSTESAVSNVGRRLFTPREQREQALDASSAAAAGTGMKTLDSQETLQPQRYEYEPSPTPASRTRPSTAGAATPDRRDRARTLTPLSIPKPLPILPSETLVRRQPSTSATNTPETPSATLRDRGDRRRATLRGGGGGSGADRPTFPAPAITTPSNATTQVTPHTVSNTPARTSFPLARADSSKSTRSQVTFSRPTKVEVEERLTDLQQQLYLDGERRGVGASGAPQSQPPSGSASETEREVKQRHQTLAGSRAARMSLGNQQPLEKRDSQRATLGRDSTAHPADRSAATTILQQQQQQQQTAASVRRERRRTVTDIWPKE
jgi:hypothetical protein